MLRDADVLPVSALRFINTVNPILMSSVGARSVRFSTISKSEASSGTHHHKLSTRRTGLFRTSEYSCSPATFPRSIPSTPFIPDGELELSPDTTYMSESDSSGVSPRQTYEYLHSHTGARDSHHSSPRAAGGTDGSAGHYVHPSPSGSSGSSAPSLISVVVPHLSKSMRAAQKTAWDVRFPPEATPYDYAPALQDPSTVSISVACDRFPEDIVLDQAEAEDPLTVADVYQALYETLQGEITAEHALYSQRSSREKADIQDATARRLGDSSAKRRRWKGQLRDLLGKHCVLYRIVVDEELGKWRLDFIEADD
jgi:hypothetical protein